MVSECQRDIMKIKENEDSYRRHDDKLGVVTY